MQNKMSGSLRLICECGTIYPVCEMPVAIDAMVKAVNNAKCPTCKKGSQKSYIYVEKE